MLRRLDYPANRGLFLIGYSGLCETRGRFRASLQAALLSFAATTAALSAAAPAFAGTIPTDVNKVVVVIEENHSYSDVINPAAPLASTPAPYINSLARAGANFTNATEAIVNPSQPNYFALFGGKASGLHTTDGQTISIPDDGRWTWTAATQSPARLVSDPSLGGQMIAAGKSFVGYSQTMLNEGSDVASSGYYQRKHNPFTQFADTADATHNRMFTTSVFPTAAGSDYSSLPTLSIVVPDQLYDMHDGTVGQGDTWLQSNLGAYATWAMTHNSLLIVAWDEGNTSSGDPRVPLVMYGPMIKPGDYGDAVNNYNLLATIEDMYGLSRLGNAASVNSISTAFVPEPGVSGVITLASFGLLRRRRHKQPAVASTRPSCCQRTYGCAVTKPGTIR